MKTILIIFLQLFILLQNIKADDFFPLKVGFQWNYETYSALQPDFKINYKTLVVSSRIDEDHLWYEMLSEGETYFFSNTDKGLMDALPSEDKRKIIDKALLYKYPVTTFPDTYQCIDGTMTISGKDYLIKTKAGEFKCYKYTYRFENQRYEEYICPGIGIVKSIYEYAKDDIEISELVSYEKISDQEIKNFIAENERNKNKDPMLKMLNEVMNDKNMKDMMLSQSYEVQNHDWDGFEKFLEPNLIPQFRKILKDQHAKKIELGFSLINLNKEEQQAMIQKVPLLKEQYEKEIKNLIGPKLFDSYKEYQKTIYARQKLREFERSGFILKDSDKKNKFIQMITKIQTKYGDGFEDQMEMGNFSNNIEDTIDREEKMVGAYKASAEKILNDEETKQFHKCLEKYLQKLKRGAEFTKMFMKNG